MIFSILQELLQITIESIDVNVNIFMEWFKLFHKYIFYFSGCECDVNVHNLVVRIGRRFRI